MESQEKNKSFQNDVSIYLDGINFEEVYELRCFLNNLKSPKRTTIRVEEVIKK